MSPFEGSCTICVSGQVLLIQEKLIAYCNKTFLKDFQ